MTRLFWQTLLGATALVGVSITAHAAEYIVPAQPDALARALEKAQDGDVLRLSAGIHQGPITIDRSLVLKGEPGAELKGNGKGSVITVEAPDVVVDGLVITGSGLSNQTIDSGVKLTKKADRARVTGNKFLNNLVGVDAHGPDDAYIADNLIEGRRDLRPNERGNGIYVWNSPRLLVEYNTIKYGRDGVFVNTSPNDTFRNNYFENTRFAVHYMYGNKGVISNNVSVDNHIGYALMFSDKLTITNNTSDGDRDHGLMLNYANNAVITGNYVKASPEKCLFMYNANKNIVDGNTFERCEIGVHFTAGSAKNKFSNNAFIGNKTQVKYVGTRHLEWTYEGRGNFWSDHSAFDMNGDGVADTAYRPNDMVDQILWTQPAAKLLTGSPAVQLLSWTQSQFPALLPGGIVDTKPLMHAPELAMPKVGARR
ncbi:nitrous oxide reductase family maturation protein NosD [Pseudovibrio ascidiaceicola]|uniref:nitrous oxide reductase family maturation protein NosD n=1 Tax=Pseudovibrio ascidiaceicola TaxID=285279 RepID=UPI000D685F79|nr:nitrous oxide reductase family maturation protein NosD [Pseudovibrio ascidiaceicola]